jgi:hypothetical protein
MLIQTFIAAAKGYGKYCPVRIELLVRRGGKVYRFTCGESDLRFAASGQPEVVFPVAPDATVRELRSAFSSILDSHATR